MMFDRLYFVLNPSHNCPNSPRFTLYVPSVSEGKDGLLTNLQVSNTCLVSVHSTRILRYSEHLRRWWEGCSRPRIYLSVFAFGPGHVSGILQPCNSWLGFHDALPGSFIGRTIDNHTVFYPKLPPLRWPSLLSISREQMSLRCRSPRYSHVYISNPSLWSNNDK